MKNTLKSVHMLKIKKSERKICESQAFVLPLFMAATLAFPSHVEAAIGAYNDSVFDGDAREGRVLNAFGGSINLGEGGTSNKLTVPDTSVRTHSKNFFAVWSNNNLASGATLTMNMSGSTISAGIFGGASRTNGARNNTVTFKNGMATHATFGIFGGFTLEDGVASNNKVELLGSSTSNSVYGGYSEKSGNAVGNVVTLSDSSTATLIYGGYSKVSGNASGNKVTINTSNATKSNIIAGGYSQSGQVSDNETIFSNGVVSHAFGGYGISGNVENNKITFLSGTATNALGGYSQDGGANTNRATMSGGIVTGVFASGYSLGGSDMGNTLEITDNSNEITTKMQATGGYVAGAGTAKSNTLTIFGGNSGNAFGGYSQDGDATDNKAIILGGTVTNVFAGGFANGAGSASGNTVEVSGGIFTGIGTAPNIMGGF